MKTKVLKDLIERIETWPKKAQDEAVDSLLSIEQELVREKDVLRWSREARLLKRAGKLPTLNSLRGL
jgi:hypothetical protein